jgi:quercetin dioxygenase-like cupin family protein
MRGKAMHALTLTAGIVAGAFAAATLGAQPPSVREAALLRTDLVGIDGKELIVSRFETAPGWVHGRHYHAGHEFVYVLEGSAIVEIEGRPPVRLGPGATAHMPPRQVHAGRNASGTEPLRFLLFRIHDKGQPLSVELGP